MHANQFKLKCLNGANFEIGIEWTPKPDRLTYSNNIWSLSYMTSINKVNFTFYNNASQFYMLESFDPSLNSGNSGKITSTFGPSEDIYTGFVKLFIFICIKYYNILFNV